MLLRQGEIDAAERCFQQALILNAQSHLGLYGLAQVAAARAQWEDAITGYQKLLELTPGFAAAIYNDLEIAYEQLEKAAELRRILEAERFKPMAVLLQFARPPGNAAEW